MDFATHLICGDWGSSDEGRDGGLCNHAVGGDAVRRGVEPAGAAGGRGGDGGLRGVGGRGRERGWRDGKGGRAEGGEQAGESTWVL